VSSPDSKRTALAATVNVATWGQISKVLTGRAWFGGTASIVAMLAADSAGSIAALPKWAQGPTTILTIPGNVALKALNVSALPPADDCCGSCAAGEKCEDDCAENPEPKVVKPKPPPKGPT
jgi:hypothetical protein